MRKLLIPLHRYISLALGLLFSLQGLTGSLLVFDHALDERLNPRLLLTLPTVQPVPLAQALAAAESAAPPGAVATLIELPRHPAGVHVVRFSAADGHRIEVTVDPYQGIPTAVRSWGEAGISWVYRLHYTLLSGEFGKNVVGASGILLLSMSLIGLYLWWPSRGRWRPVLRLRLNGGSLPLHYDLHRLLGALAAPVLVVISFAGIYIVFAAAFHTASDRLFPPVRQPLPTLQAAPQGIVDLDMAAAIARSVYPSGELKRILLPKGDGSYRVTLRQPGEPLRSSGLTHVWIDREGRIGQVRDYASANPGQRFLAWLFPLHNGEALGLPGRILVAMTGLAPAILFITGLFLWAIKRHRPGQARP